MVKNKKSYFQSPARGGQASLTPMIPMIFFCGVIFLLSAVTLSFAQSEVEQKEALGQLLSMSPMVNPNIIGIDLSQAVSGTAAGIGSGPATIWYSQVTLSIADQQEKRQWPAWVGFTSARLRNALLGYAGCLQFFDADFRGHQEYVELTVNPLYPGI